MEVALYSPTLLSKALVCQKYMLLFLVASQFTKPPYKEPEVMLAIKETVCV